MVMKIIALDEFDEELDESKTTFLVMKMNSLSCSYNLASESLDIHAMMMNSVSRLKMVLKC